MVSSRDHRRASKLLEQFNKRGNELTWNSDGIIFIDQTSIPESDIFLFFPKLFKKSLPKNLPGFEDFVQKIADMGLDHLISSKSPKSDHISGEGSSKITSPNWWYIG